MVEARAPTGSRRAVEYFAGIGLNRIALENAGWEVVFANDISGNKYKIYQTFFDDAESKYRVKNIYDLDPAEIPKADLAVSSFPCIDLSLAGSRKGIHGNHSGAFWGLVKILKAQGENSPRIILLENVPGWLSSNKGKDFFAVINAMNELGYSCDAFVLDALRFTPQSRKRVFVVGIKGSRSVFDEKKLLAREGELLSKRLRNLIQDNKDARWITLDIPSLPSIKESGLAKDVIERQRLVSKKWWTEEKVEHHVSMMAENHLKILSQRRDKKSWTYRTFSRRMRVGKQKVEIRNKDTAGCLRAATGGSSRQFVVALGFGKVKMRNMTAREYARLQGVPESYPLNGNENLEIHAFGDAVCVPAVAWILENIVNPVYQEVGSSS